MKLDFKKFIFGEVKEKNKFLTLQAWLENNTPKCPNCNSSMVLRTATKGNNPGRQFYGCSKWPNCKGTRGYNPNYQTPNNPPIVDKPIVDKPIVDNSFWTYAKVIDINYFQLTVGQQIAVRQKNNDEWEFKTLTSPEKTGTLPTKHIKNIIQSFRKDNKPIQSLNPSLEDLNKQLDIKQEIPEQPTGKNPHILDQSKLSEEQAEIDKDFEKIINGQQNHMMINALAGTGKAQPLDSLLLTPNGWKKMGDIQLTDKVFGSDGKPHDIEGIFPQGIKEIYEVTFSDGVKTECCGEHLWLTETKQNRDLCRYHKQPLFSRSQINNTKTLINDLKYKNYPKHYIPLVQPLCFDNKEVPIDPYVLGVLLGDGNFTSGSIAYSTADKEIIESVNSLLPSPLTSKKIDKNKYDYRIVGNWKLNYITSSIKKLNLYGKNSETKFIPDIYKFNNTSTRIALLQGLLDTDGYIQKIKNKNTGNNIEYYTVSIQLAEDVRFLVESLGGTVTCSIKNKPKYTYKNEIKFGKPCYRLNLKLPNYIIPFRLTRKKERYIPKLKYLPKRSIVSIEKIGEKECQCISINSNDNLYLTNNCILTHNTTILKHLAWKYGKPGQKWLYLVFNTKNRVEAQESSGGYRKFPEFVEINTTNSFLGHVLSLPENLDALPQTERIIKLKDPSKNDQKLEKSRLLIDGHKFQEKFMTNFPEANEVKNRLPKLLNNVGVYSNDHSIYEKTIISLINNIRSQFQEKVLKLVDLGKSFAINPNSENYHEELKKVYDKYDSHTDEDGVKTGGYFETDLPQIKERISKYKPDFKSRIISVLNKIFNYDFMAKDYENEVIEAAIWLLEQAMPYKTDEKYTQSFDDGNSIEHNLGDYRDFSDDIWYATLHSDKINWPKYDIVLADEVQDFNAGQKIMLQKLAEKGAKIVAVGDPNQCHPAGTIISLTGGVKKSIEDIEIGDEVVTYNTKKSYFPGTISQGRKVEEISCRNYSGEIITIQTETSNVKCTPNHKCLVKLNTENKYCLYLMTKDQIARVGICRANYLNGFGLTIRAIQEKADKAWLLNIFNTEKEARIAEIVTATKFGLPQMIFINNGQMFPSQEFINEVYEQINDNIENAKKCISSFGRQWEFPIWTSELQQRFGSLKKNYIGSKKSFITQACNLISGFMQVRTFDGTNRGGKWELINISKENTICKVYSLKVQPTEDGKRLYVADGIVVHNSIYRFRGADGDAFGNLGDMLKDMSTDKENWKPKKLSYNFRSTPEVLNFVNDQTHVKDLKTKKDFSNAKIPGMATRDKVKYDDSFRNIEQERKLGQKIETAYIARTNEPLVHAALKLLGKGIPFAIIGKDISAGLNGHIKKILKEYRLTNKNSVLDLQRQLDDHEQKEVNKNQKYSTKKEYLQSLKDMTLALHASINQFLAEKQSGTVQQFTYWLADKLGSNTFDFDQSGENGESQSIEDLKKFREKVEKEKPVVLTTAHKSKGLEFERVYILRDDQFPHPRAKHPDEIRSENNAKYVAYTRAQHQLHILNKDGQPGAK